MGEALERLEDMVCDGINELADKGELKIGDLDAVDKLTHSLKSIRTIEAMDNKGYSNDVYPKEYRRYSRDGMADKLRTMMNEATSDKERSAIRECLSKIEK